MSAAGSAARKRISAKTKPYVMKKDEKTGELYLEKQRPPFVGELPYVAALVFTSVFAILSCFQYIQLRTNVESRMIRTAALEREFQTLKNENILTECSIYQTPDLGSVYEAAVGTLGMVPVTSEHVRTYERSNSEYVYQTDSIPNIGS